MRRKLLLTFICGVVVSFLSCAQLQNILKEAINKPTVSFEKMSLSDLTLFDTTMLFDFKVTNPNPVGIRVRNIGYDLKIYGNGFAKGVLDKGIDMSANSSNVVQLPVKVNFMDLFKTGMDYIQNDQVNYDISGTVGIGSFDIPYQKAGSFIKPKLPSLSLKNLKINKLDITGANLLFDMDVSNPNKFPLSIKGIDYGIKLSDVEFTKGGLDRATEVAASGKSTLQMPVDISILKLGQSAFNILGKKSSAYELYGDMKFNIPGFGERRFPFKRTGEIPLLK